jgi:hypothetical protein
MILFYDYEADLFNQFCFLLSIRMPLCKVLLSRAGHEKGEQNGQERSSMKRKGRQGLIPLPA